MSISQLNMNLEIMWDENNRGICTTGNQWSQNDGCYCRSKPHPLLSMHSVDADRKQWNNELLLCLPFWLPWPIHFGHSHNSISSLSSTFFQDLKLSEPSEQASKASEVMNDDAVCMSITTYRSNSYFLSFPLSFQLPTKCHLELGTIIAVGFLHCFACFGSNRIK